jgi:hypothetical protein
MAFPSLAPTARSFDPGDWPTKRFASQSGAEIRILYGSQRVNAKLELSYDNITDTEAEQFLTDYDSQLGTLRTFNLPTGVTTGTSVSMEAPPQTKWRYDAPPAVASVRPGISSVKVSLVAVA